MKRQARHVRFNPWLLALLLLALIAGQVGAQDMGGVKLAVFKGPVTPVLASYLDRAIADAEATGASAVILQLDTPGGSVDITKEITQRMQSSAVPVIVYVAPSGARGIGGHVHYARWSHGRHGAGEQHRRGQPGG